MPMHRLHVDQMVWERHTVHIEVPDAVVAEGQEAVETYLRERYQAGDFALDEGIHTLGEAHGADAQYEWAAAT